MPPSNGGCGLWLMCDVPLPIEATEAGPMEAVSTVSVVIDKHALPLQARSQNAVQHGAKKRPRDAAYFAAANRAARARKKARGAALEGARLGLCGQPG